MDELGELKRKAVYNPTEGTALYDSIGKIDQASITLNQLKITVDASGFYF